MSETQTATSPSREGEPVGHNNNNNNNNNINNTFPNNSCVAIFQLTCLPQSNCLHVEGVLSFPFVEVNNNHSNCFHHFILDVIITVSARRFRSFADLTIVFVFCT